MLINCHLGRIFGTEMIGQRIPGCMIISDISL